MRLLALHLEEPSDVTPEANRIATIEIRNRWLLASKGFFAGCVPSYLEEATNSAEKRLLVRRAILALSESLRKAPPIIDHRHIALLGIEDWYESGTLELSRLIEAGQAFLDLIDATFRTEIRSH